ncbi:4-amino-4-deoxy-L-arabinose transferase [Caulobacter sp. D4A]|uniref:ArnT family glycosyltransferase n=1 Tax=unclassified Caulobacter TaxID=2648921 RepID=UPI000D730753|nr:MULTISPECIES: glycosyltransferase family 39 protein [unclassified Caulobacter]PXA77605.1 4-amino-4-deoxy-L-arabinose transferase [Caulobacter sp. D4A]PXA96128.1 4-amino-4-deoxy-L-arabinose transferase [Caulobacter sp. D5]
MTAPPYAAEDSAARAWRLTLIGVALLTIVRVLAIFSTPLELYPDEAQYWLWSRTLDFGYYSKPPMIAWVIWLTTQIGGDTEGWLRLGAPLLHGATALIVHRIARRLYGGWTGLAAAGVYALMPGVQLSSGVIGTDAPLLFFLALTIWAYVSLPAARTPRERLLTAAGLGAALGLAFLSKYAAIYVLFSIGAHLALSREARKAWTWPMGLAFFGVLIAIFAPNLIWNAAHKFATVEHTAANANWGAKSLFNPRELVEFVGSQFGVFGPLPFGVLLGGGIVLAARKRLQPADVLLLCFALPPLLTVAGQAFVSRANANWAAAAYVAGSVLVAGWMVRWSARRWLAGGLALQAAFAALFLACLISPRLADGIGLANSFKRVRGWDQTVQAIINRAREEQAGARLTSVAVDDRFLFNVAAYYGRDYWGTVGAPPLRIWVHEAHPQNQAETEAPMTKAYGERTLIASLEGVYKAKIEQDFKATSGDEIVRVRLDRKRVRRTDLFIAEGFAPVARDPKTGLPPNPEKGGSTAR